MWRAENHSLYSVGRSAELQMRGAIDSLKWQDVYFQRRLEDTAQESKQQLEERLDDQQREAYMDYQITRGRYTVQRNGVAQAGSTVGNLSYSFWPGTDPSTVASICDRGQATVGADISQSTVGESTIESQPRGPEGTGTLPIETDIPQKETGTIPKTAKPIGQRWNVPRRDSSHIQPDDCNVLV